MEGLGYVYKIQNKVNNKVYIGQTTNNPFNRFKEHFAHCKTGDVNTGLYSDMSVYGIEGFVMEVLESNIPLECLDAREIYYIKQFNSVVPNGYNIALGGHCNKLTEQAVREIIQRIKDGAVFKDLAVVFNVGYSTISDINCGDTWHFDDECYPIRQQVGKKKNFSEEIIHEIYALLRDDVSLTAIGKRFNTSAQTIRRINLGEIYRHEGIDYPIKVFSRSNVTPDTLEGVLYDLENTDLSFNLIAEKYNIDRHTVSAINDGTRYSSMVSEFGYLYFPIRN